MENDLFAWLMYLFGALGLCAFVWRLVRPLRREWRHLLVASALALLLTPAMVDPELGDWAPALLILVLDTTFEGSADLTQVALTLAIGWLLALMASLALLLLPRSRAPVPLED